MYPEESAEMADKVCAKAVVPIHWGAFCISDHAWDDSIIRFTWKAAEIGLNVLTPHISETVDIECMEKYKDNWW
jgi:L-ascorbate metabolism protein UlaG (beta-lactamase superfamily)